MAEKIYRKQQITVETHKVTIIRTKCKSYSAFCEFCQQNVIAFSIEQIAAVFAIDLNEVHRQIESGELHLITGKSIALVCANSLEK